MKILKTSNNNNDWIDNLKLNKLKNKTAENIMKSKNVCNVSNDKVNDEILALECEKIEKCASNQQEYFYNKSWSEQKISQLKEYAMVVGLENNKFIPAEYIENLDNIQQFADLEKTASISKNFIKTASTSKLKLDLGDPFKITERSDTSYMDKKNWETNIPAQKLNQNPSIMGGIVPVRGGENLNIQNTPRLANNQNSLVNPNAIEDLASSNQMDTGARLLKEKQEKLAKIQNDKKQWEQDIINSMEHNNIVAKGKVFPTETLNAQSGLATPHSQKVADKFNPDQIPDKTAGEMLAKQNAERHASISRPKIEDAWEAPSGASIRGVSDVFGDSLKKTLGK